jgi:hypothetical protein
VERRVTIGATGRGGTSGWECGGFAGCPGDAAPATCPEIVSQPNYACSSKPTSVACALPPYPQLIRSGQDVYVVVDKLPYQVGPGGLTPLVQLDTTYVRDVLVDDGYVYYFDDRVPPRLQLVRRRIDGGGDAPAPSWTCAGETSSLYGNLVADRTAIFMRTASGTFRIDKGVTPPSRASFLSEGITEAGSMAVDDAFLYVSGLYLIGSLQKTSTSSCACDASSGPHCPGDSGGTCDGAAPGGFGVEPPNALALQRGCTARVKTNARSTGLRGIFTAAASRSP